MRRFLNDQAWSLWQSNPRRMMRRVRPGAPVAELAYEKRRDGLSRHSEVLNDIAMDVGRMRITQEPLLDPAERAVLARRCGQVDVAARWP